MTRFQAGRLRLASLGAILGLLVAVAIAQGSSDKPTSGLSAKPLAAPNSRERVLSFDSQVTVNADSTLDVQETIHVLANREKIRHGIMRDFPTRYPDGSGAIHVVGFHVRGVKRDDKSEPFNVSPWQNGKRVRVGRGDVDLVPGEYTYVISYRTDHQLGFFTEHDELYWNATGFWSFPIDKAYAHIALPHGVPPKQVLVSAYTGPQGGKGTAWTAKVSKTGIAEFVTTAPLRANEGMTIVVGWPKGFVTQPPAQIESPSESPSKRMAIPFEFKPGWWKLDVIHDDGGRAMLWAALLLLGLYIAAWFAVGRDPEAGSVQVVYEPPQQLSPAAMRYLRSLGTDAKTFTCAVVSLASKGYLTIRHDGSAYTLVRTGGELKTTLTADELAVSQLLFVNGPSTAGKQAEAKAQLAEFSNKHPTIGKFVPTLLALMGPEDDAKTTHLRPSSEPVRTAYQALQTELKAAFPRKSIMRTNAWCSVLAVLYTLAVTYWCLRTYPEAVSRNNFLLAPFAVFFLLLSLVAVLKVADLLSAVLPVESFAPRRSFGRKEFLVVSAVIAVVFAIALGWVVAWLTSVEWAAAFAMMWLLVGIFHRLIKAPTEAGQRLWNEIEGFRQFLAEVDEDRLDRMNPPEKTPALFESMLPYAIALDCENAWAKQFENVLVMAAASPEQTGTTATLTPSWYSGPAGGMTDLVSFTDSFSSSLGSTIASSTAAPGSSSGFDSSGGGDSGGSSGGGGGGGGGSGW